MASYLLRCNDCGEEEEYNVPMREHSTMIAGAFCQCGGQVKQVITLPGKVFVRTGFPTGIVHEHISDIPVRLRDKKHFQDVCTENGWTSHHYDGI